MRKLPADLHTPIGVYLKLRDRFHNSILLESSDHHGKENSFSFICCKPVASVMVQTGNITFRYPGQVCDVKKIKKNGDVLDALIDFRDSFEISSAEDLPVNGIFGFTSYDCIRYFEELKMEKRGYPTVPDLHYSVYKYVIGINHFNDEMFILEYFTDGEVESPDEIISLLQSRSIPSYAFDRKSDEGSMLSDKEYVSSVRSGKEYCRQGNVFQVVLSREFNVDFSGDDFNVYRSLRMINPSPYLFYFDMGNFRIFGSSPEAQLVVKDRTAQIHPIAGTFRRTGDEAQDALLAIKLRNDKKENAEHVMLVDLARNDLSRSCTSVNVEVFAETQYYSHVIHLVSRVSGILKPGRDPLQLFAETFPAGTLSGAPKHKALQLIDLCESSGRGYYGGAIGYIGFNGDMNQAIIIRSFLSADNKLLYRAGAGVVIASKEENELQEVNNKLAALKKAVEMAETL